jgi:hypothetical protein
MSNSIKTNDQPGSGLDRLGGYGKDLAEHRRREAEHSANCDRIAKQVIASDLSNGRLR